MMGRHDPELNPQPLPPGKHVEIPVELLKRFTTDMRIVRGPVNGTLVIPWAMLSELQGLQASKLAVLIVDSSEVE